MHGNYPLLHRVTIPETALATIGGINSLEQLCLKAGMWAGINRHQWLVDHTQLQHHLRNLNKLKLLALARDTYPASPGLDPKETYYSRQYVGRQEWKDAKRREDLATLADMEDDEEENTDANHDDDNEGHHQHLIPHSIRFRVWERCHRNRMLKHAEGYAETLPSLEWLLCGQRPIAFPRGHAGQPLRLASPKPLTDGRDLCITFLEKTFGLKSGDS